MAKCNSSFYGASNEICVRCNGSVYLDGLGCCVLPFKLVNGKCNTSGNTNNTNNYSNPNTSNNSVDFTRTPKLNQHSVVRNHKIYVTLAGKITNNSNISLRLVR